MNIHSIPINHTLNLQTSSKSLQQNDSLPSPKNIVLPPPPPYNKDYNKDAQSILGLYTYNKEQQEQQEQQELYYNQSCYNMQYPYFNHSVFHPQYKNINNISQNTNNYEEKYKSLEEKYKSLEEKI